MNTARSAVGMGQAPASTRGFSSSIRCYWDAFQERRKFKKLQSDLNGLSDRELGDIGIARGEIDYVAANRSIDPRGFRL
ncbi:DUF1127 domain-containing protein [Bradyrhizobium sp. URHC0002]